MLNKTTVSAPGKLLLFGEHAVVYGRPCIVTAVDQRMTVAIEQIEEQDLILDAPDVQISGYRKPLTDLGSGEIPKGARFVELAVKNSGITHGVKISVSPGFSPLFGFGSSSAITVCVLAGLYGNTIAKKELFSLAYKTVLDVQGKGSGFDVAAAIWGGTLWFETAGKKITPLTVKSLPLVIGYTGEKADTVSLVNDVFQKRQKEPEKVERIFEAISKIVTDAKHVLESGDWERAGRLMDFNQDYLRNLGVSSEKLEDLILAAKNAGAYGAKLSGAGGGDCMIALAPPDKKTAIMEAISLAGGQPVDIETGVPGVRIEL